MLIETLAIVLSVASFLFSIFTFQWIHWRKGKLLVSMSRVLGIMAYAKQEFVVLRIPLVFVNTGVTNKTVSNIRLKITQGGELLILNYNKLYADLSTTTNNHTWALPISISGNSSQIAIMEFLKTKTRFQFKEESCKFIFEVKLADDKTWEQVFEEELPIPQKYLQSINSNTDVVYDLDPDRV